MSKTTNKFSPEVHERAVRMVIEHEGEHPSRWAAIISLSGEDRLLSPCSSRMGKEGRGQQRQKSWHAERCGRPPVAQMLAFVDEYRGEDIVLTLERICKSFGYPKTIRADQGSGFISRDLDLWAYQKGVVLAFSRPGKPTDNAFIESFNGKFRAECLNAHWFMSLEDAREKMESWRRDYNEVRAHSAISNKPKLVLTNGSPATIAP